MPGIRKVPLQNSLPEYRCFLTTLGAVLRRWRRIRRFSYAGLATMVGCTATFIRYIETGRRGVSLEKAVVICRVLDIPLSMLTPMLRVKIAARRPVRAKAAPIPLRSQVVRERAEAARRKTLAA